MRSSDVTFRTIETPIEDGQDNAREIDIIEITYPDGKVVGFPATDKSPETGIRYCDMYAAKYKAFKDGEPDPDEVEQLEREIEERKAKLNELRGGKREADKRVQENLGYGKTDAKTKAKESHHPKKVA